MSYPSIDTLQKVLSEQVFSHTKDSKKAAGRALGTLVEIITFYLLKEWGIHSSISIERGLAEYGNPSITHNVEFTLHPLINQFQIESLYRVPLTAKKIAKEIQLDNKFHIKNNTLLTKDNIIKNACVIAEDSNSIILGSIEKIQEKKVYINIYQQRIKPYAMFECKRVGIEEGTKKGPQTIEKAKQGAYVAKTTSSLQKIRNEQGCLYGVIYQNNQPIIAPYNELLQSIINNGNNKLLKDFSLSIGIVSNHGNWFTSKDQNKELKVLAQSYDWLLFLSDHGLAQFITDLLLKPIKQYQIIQDSFLNSYKEDKKNNIFTKIKMDYNANIALSEYFHNNISIIEQWFNVITPEKEKINMLKQELEILKEKDWRSIL